MRRYWVGIAFALVTAGCGGEMSMGEYVEDVNAMVDQTAQQYFDLVASSEGAVLVAGPEQLADYTPQDLQAALEQVREIEAGFEKIISTIDPPERVAGFHYLLFDFDDDFIPAQEALAARAGTTTTWEELSASPEMAAYRNALAEDRQQCDDVQTRINAMADRSDAFADTPWIPGELKAVAEAALGCDGYPAHPEDVYRPRPESTP